MIPDVLKNPDTEPEAAYLRGVLRRLNIVLSVGAEPPWSARSSLMRLTEHVQRALRIPASDTRIAMAKEIIRSALKRPRTNGHVIDELTRENGDLLSAIDDLKLKLGEQREELIALKLHFEVDDDWSPE